MVISQMEVVEKMGYNTHNIELWGDVYEQTDSKSVSFKGEKGAADRKQRRLWSGILLNLGGKHEG